jgi:hypothetical protein
MTRYGMAISGSDNERDANAMPCRALAQTAVVAHELD